MNAICTIIQKEWAEVRKNKLVLSVVLFVPLLMTIIPLVMLALMGRIGGQPERLRRAGPHAGQPDLCGLEPDGGDAVDAWHRTSSSSS